MRGRAHHAPRAHLPAVPGVQGMAIPVERGKGHTRPQEEAKVGAEQLPAHLTPLGGR